MNFKHYPAESVTTWIVVADRGRARLLAASPDKEGLSELETLVNPEGAMRQSENVSDGQGYFGGRTGSLEAGDPETDYKRKTAGTFATLIINRLEAGRNSQQFRHVVLIAAPAFLGELRKKLPAPLERMVTGQIDKDYSKCSPAEIAVLLEKARVAETQGE